MQRERTGCERDRKCVVHPNARAPLTSTDNRPFLSPRFLCMGPQGLHSEGGRGGPSGLLAKKRGRVQFRGSSSRGSFTSVRSPPKITRKKRHEPKKLNRWSRGVRSQPKSPSSSPRDFRDLLTRVIHEREEVPQNEGPPFFSRGGSEGPPRAPMFEISLQAFEGLPCRGAKREPRGVLVKKGVGPEIGGPPHAPEIFS